MAALFSFLRENIIFVTSTLIFIVFFAVLPAAKKASILDEKQGLNQAEIDLESTSNATSPQISNPTLSPPPASPSPAIKKPPFDIEEEDEEDD